MAPPRSTRSDSRPARASAVAAGALLAVVAALLAILHRGAFEGCYGFVDDYALIDPARRFPDPRFLSWTLSEGRPLYGLLLNALLLPVGEVCALAAIRALNLLMVAGIAVQCHLLAVRSGWPAAVAAAMALLVAAAPGYAVAIAWATLVGPLAAIMLGLAAARAASAAGDAPGGMRRLVAAGLLLVAALAVYQPGAMAFVPGIAIALVRRPATWATVQRHLLPAAGVLVAGLGVYGVLFLLSANFVDSDFTSTRADLVDDPWRKLVWFVGIALRQSLNLFNIEPVPRFGLAVTVLIAAGAWLRERSPVRTVAALLAQGGAIALAFLPNLAVEESWPAFRSSLPMTMTIAVLAAAALLAIAERLPARIGAVAAPLAIGLPALYGLAATADAAETGIVRLQKVEWSTLRAGLQRTTPADPRSVVMVRASEKAPPACVHWQRFDEFWLPSSARPFGAAAMRRRAWAEIHGGPPPERFTIADAAPPASADRIVIDLGATLAAQADAICRR